MIHSTGSVRTLVTHGRLPKGLPEDRKSGSVFEFLSSHGRVVKAMKGRQDVGHC